MPKYNGFSLNRPIRLTFAAAVLVMACLSVFPAESRQQSASPRLFTFETDEFWLNLHHFLYVLGRAEAKMPDAGETSVASAPREVERGLQGLTREEQMTWAGAVSAYASGLSLKSNPRRGNDVRYARARRR